MGRIAAVVAAVAARAVGALPLPLSPVDEPLRPKDHSYVVAKLASSKKARRKQAPLDLPLDVEEQIREAREELPDRPELGVVGSAERSPRVHHQAEHSLWLGGKYRQALTNYADVQYIAYLEVGGQTLSGVLDTGSFELVVIGELCKECGDGPKYLGERSATHRSGKLVSGQSYGSGDLWSQDAYDMVSIGPYDAKNQSFWEVTKAKMPVLGHSAFESIVGIGPPETPLADAVEYLQADERNATQYRNSGKPVPDDLEKKLQHRREVVESFKHKPTMLDTFGTSMFSLCIGREPLSDGYVIWNDTAPLVKPEHFRRVPVVGEHTWSVQLGSPRFRYPPGAPELTKSAGDLPGCKDGCGALLDSGTSLLAVPSSIMRNFYEVFQAREFDCGHIENLPSIQFRLGEHTFTLPPDVYVARVDEPVPEYLQSFVRLRKIETHRPNKSADARCNMMVMESTATTAHGPLWILGLPFYRNYYTTFEVGHHKKGSRFVHFAKASDSCTPAAPDDGDDSAPSPTQLYRRDISPTKLYVSSSIQRALTASFVHL